MLKVSSKMLPAEFAGHSDYTLPNATKRKRAKLWPSPKGYILGTATKCFRNIRGVERTDQLFRRARAGHDNEQRGVRHHVVLLVRSPPVWPWVEYDASHVARAIPGQRPPPKRSLTLRYLDGARRPPIRITKRRFVQTT